MFRRKTKVAAAPTTAGALVYAIGDVHGRRDLLRLLIADIEADARVSASSDRPALIFLGDYVDRGPDSRGVIDLILDVQAGDRFEVHALKGNHEDVLLRFLDEPGVAGAWLDYGGAATLSSYGVDPRTTGLEGDTFTDLRDAFARALPAGHRAFLQQLELTITIGDYAFAHAGVRPNVSLDRQVERDLLWIRGDFLEARGPFEKVIVHGHTASEAPQATPYRIGVDTGAYATGVLTAVRLHDTDRRFLQARLPGAA